MAASLKYVLHAAHKIFPLIVSHHQPLVVSCGERLGVLAIGLPNVQNRVDLGAHSLGAVGGNLRVNSSAFYAGSVARDTYTCSVTV